MKMKQSTESSVVGKHCQAKVKNTSCKTCNLKPHVDCHIPNLNFKASTSKSRPAPESSGP